MKPVITSEQDDLVSLAVVRSLGKKNIDFTVVSGNNRALAFHSKFCKINHVSNGDMKFFAGLKTDDVIFPMSEDIMCRLSKNREKIACSLAFPEHSTLETVSNKIRLIGHALEHEIPCPETHFINKSDDLETLPGVADFPVVLRPRTGSGGKGITFIDSNRELQAVKKDFFRIHGPYMIQEKIPFKHKFTVGVLCNADSQVRRICVIKEIRNYPFETGPACCVETVRYPELEKLSVRLMESLHYYGIADIDFLVDERTGKPVLMEINPRFWGSVQVAINAGVDFPFLLYELVTSGDIGKSFDYKTGVRCRHVIIDDLLRLISILKGPCSLSFKVHSVIEFLTIHPREGYYIFSLEDLQPFRRHVLNKIKKNLYTGHSRIAVTESLK